LNAIKFGVSAVSFLWILLNLIFLASAWIDFSDSWLCCFLKISRQTFGLMDVRGQRPAITDQ